MKTIKNQTIQKVKVIGNEKLVVTIRHDDQCCNGHNSFSITGTLSEGRKEVAWGCLHEEVARFFPELRPYLKWHLCSTDGPMHYAANTVYLAGYKDCNGLNKGERRQLKNGKTGLPAWQLVAVGKDGVELEIYKVEKYQDSETQPACDYSLEYRPWCRVGEGKEPELEAARNSAIWPDATLEQLQDKAVLEARLPALLEEFRAAVESLGLTY